MIVILKKKKKSFSPNQQTIHSANAVINFSDSGENEIVKNRYGPTGPMKYGKILRAILRAELGKKELTPDELAKILLEFSSGV